jgi:hypothetical protein
VPSPDDAEPVISARALALVRGAHSRDPVASLGEPRGPPEMLLTMRVGGLKHAGDVVLVRQLYGNLPMPQLKHRRHE